MIPHYRNTQSQIKDLYSKFNLQEVQKTCQKYSCCWLKPNTWWISISGHFHAPVRGHSGKFPFTLEVSDISSATNTTGENKPWSWWTCSCHRPWGHFWQTWRPLVFQYEYALRHLYALVNLCERGYSAGRYGLLPTS